MAIEKTTNKLYWKISATFLFLLILVGVTYILISTYTAQNYYQKVSQKLQANLAESTIKEVRPFIDGRLDTMAIQDIMHSMMVINPSVEVYLLDTEGRIITYVAPYKRVQLDRVDLDPVKTFIASREKPFIKGSDPRHPGEKKVFSAAPIVEGDALRGYMYIILASEEQSAVSSTLFGSYMFSLGSKLFFITLISSLIIGLLAIWYITRSLRNIIGVVRRFKEGDLKVRIAPADSRDVPVLGETFNEMADSIVENIDQLRSVEMLRRELIANVSHDLRTPLAIMQGYIETLQIKEEQLSVAERQRYLQIVLNSAENLSHLISQLFEYSKLEAKQMELQKEPFFIGELAQDIYHKYQILAKAKNINLQVSIPRDIPLVFADVSLVERVLQNLMDNAIKYTPEHGDVTITLESVNGAVEVKIANSGTAIPDEEQSYIFERYQQSRATRDGKGAGLGLAIAQKIMELHNATIRVRSKINEGTAFMFRLPEWVG
ncbi:MAG: HAMP domain-containing histidine kinase [Saprospiraceae bacterium]|nr:HAMP domain-containing histidine kinase [Saprospiraceae bacterium]